jgi:hypothetical protein
VQRAINQGIACDIDYRIYLPSGEIRHANGKGETVKNEFGHVVRLLGTAPEDLEADMEFGSRMLGG